MKTLRSIFLIWLPFSAICSSFGQVIVPGLIATSSVFNFPTTLPDGAHLISSLGLDSAPNPPSSFIQEDFGLYSDGAISTSPATIGYFFAFYGASNGEAIDFNFITTQPMVGGNIPDPVVSLPKLSQIGQSIDLAFYTDVDGDAGGNHFSTPDLGDQLGWGQLTRAANGLRLTSSAMDVSGNGIVVGSFASIPESSAYASIAGVLALGAAALRRRRIKPAL